MQDGEDPYVINPVILDSMDLGVSLFASVTNIIPSLVTQLMDVACVNQDGQGMSVRCFVQKGSLVQDA